jgi:hypothetical protein
VIKDESRALPWLHFRATLIPMATRATILERVIDPKRGNLSADFARYILALGFPPADQARYAELAAKAQEGPLSPDERAELDEFLDVNDFLTIVHSKARASLTQHNSAA